MSDATTQHIPADVREPTDAQINVWSIIRSALSRAWALSRPWAVADRPQVTSEVVARLDAIAADCEREVLALLRTPRGEGEAEPVAWRVEYRRRGDGDARWYHLSTYTNEMDARERAKHAEGPMRVLECRIIPLYASPAAALRSDAQGEVWREVDDLLARLERFEYDAAGESEEYWRVVAMRDRIAAARRGEGGGE